MRRVPQLQSEVRSRLHRGEPLSQVEDDVIEPSGLSDDGKSALWLYAWAYLERGRTRYEEHQNQLRRGARFSQPVLGTE